MNAYDYLTAKSFDAATQHLAEADTKGLLVKAAGIDVLDRLKEGIDRPRVILNLRQIRPKGEAMRVDGGDLVIHALTTLAVVGGDERIAKHFPAVAQSASHAATPQIRNAATVGGNLCQKPRCWYYRSHDYPCLKKGGGTCFAVEGDNRYHAVVGAGSCHIVHPSNMAVPLMAYDASVRLVRHGKGGMASRDVKLDDFYRVPFNPQDDEHILEPDELIQEIRVPTAAGGPRSGYVEIRHKQSFDWPMVTCAVNLNDPVKPRIVLGAVAPIPWRLKRVEALVAGKELTDELIAEARKLSMRGMQPMRDNAYKVQLVGAALEDALRKASGRERKEDA